MSPKEKAKQLIDRFKIDNYDYYAQGNETTVIGNSLILVDEILKTGLYKNSRIFWEQVKIEIENYEN